MAKPFPAKKPFWLFFLPSVAVGTAWTYLPYVFYPVFHETPILAPRLVKLFGPNAALYLSYALPTFVTLMALMPVCRGIQLMDPEEFDQYNEED
jgi:hypothetical protein